MGKQGFRLALESREPAVITGGADPLYLERRYWHPWHYFKATAGTTKDVARVATNVRQDRLARPQREDVLGRHLSFATAKDTSSALVHEGIVVFRPDASPERTNDPPGLACQLASIARSTTGVAAL